MREKYFTREKGKTQNPNALRLLERPGFETNDIETAIERLSKNGGGWIFDENGRPIRYVAAAPWWNR